MKLFYKVAIIAFFAQVAYWLLAAVIFGNGQLILHIGAAIVGGTYLTVALIKKYKKILWLAPFVWVMWVGVCLCLIFGTAQFVNWTLNFVPVTIFWNAVRLFDFALLSVLIGAAGAWYKLHRTS